MNWYSAIALFKNTRSDEAFQPQFEERVSIVQANDINHAESLFLAEFREYADEHTEFLDLYDIKEMTYAPGKNPVEVISTSRVTGLSDEAYVEKFWKTKPNDCSEHGWECCWYRKSDTIFGCYNCGKEKHEG